MPETYFQCGNDHFRREPDGSVVAVRNEGRDVVARFDSEDQALAWSRDQASARIDAARRAVESSDAWHEKQCRDAEFLWLVRAILAQYGHEFPADWHFGAGRGPATLAFLAERLFAGRGPTFTETAGILGMVPRDDEPLFRELAAAYGVRLDRRREFGSHVGYGWAS